ncbi:MAG: DNA polymerase III subunit delta [Thermodesulfobacteriota bacterium]
MVPADFERDLAARSFKPLYLFHGQEAMTRERLLEKLAAAVPSELRDFNYQSFLADETPAGQVLANARTLPFFGPPRVIVVRGLDHYPVEQLALFQDYLRSPNEETCLVLVVEKPDFRLSFFKSVREAGLEVAFNPPRGLELAAWVKRSMTDRGLKMTEAAAKAIIDQVGSDVMALDRELEKVYLYALDKKEVSVEDVLTAARLGLTANVFKLGDAVGRQSPGPALAALKELLLTEHHLPILVMLIRHFRLLLKARLVVDRRGGPDEAARYLGLQTFVARNYLEQAKRLVLADIKKGLIRLQEANLALVTSSVSERLVMEKLVLDLSTLRPESRTGT